MRGPIATATPTSIFKASANQLAGPWHWTNPGHPQRGESPGYGPASSFTGTGGSFVGARLPAVASSTSSMSAACVSLE